MTARTWERSSGWWMSSSRHLLVVAVRGAAMDQREIAALVAAAKLRTATAAWAAVLEVAEA